MGAPQPYPNQGSQDPHHGSQAPSLSFTASQPPPSPYPPSYSQEPPASLITSVATTITDTLVDTLVTTVSAATTSSSQTTATTTSIPALAENQQPYTMPPTTSSTITHEQSFSNKQQNSDTQQMTSTPFQTTTRSPNPATPTNPYYTPSGSPQPGNIWKHLGPGAQTGVVIVVLLGLFTIITLSIWFCCGCCGVRRRRQKRIEARNSGVEDGAASPSIPLDPMTPRAVPVTLARGDAPPPRYEEVAPPQHQTIAGGISHVREEEEAMVADGKTPLSEIPFEDVVLDRTNGEGSSGTFEARHYTLGGDTTGHTNS